MLHINRPVRDAFRISATAHHDDATRTQAVSVSSFRIFDNRVTTRQEASFEYVTVFAVIDCQGAQLTPPIAWWDFSVSCAAFVHRVAPVFLL